MVGHLTSATVLSSGAVYAADGAVELRADAEIAVELLDDVEEPAGADEVAAAIGAYGVALELVDFGASPDDAQAGNEEIVERVAAAARALGAAGERLRRGDTIVTGSIVQVAVAPAPGTRSSRRVAGLGRPGVGIA